MKIMVVSNMAESLVNFRGPLLREFRDAGYEVLTVAPEEDDPRIAVLEGMGMRYVAVPMSRVGIDPLRDLGFLSRLVALMRAERPSVVLAYTTSPSCTEWSQRGSHEQDGEPPSSTAWGTHSVRLAPSSAWSVRSRRSSTASPVPARPS